MNNQVTILGDSHHTRADLKMIERAVKQRWPVTEANAATIVERLMRTVEKTVVDVPVKDGVFASDAVADSNATAAASVLVRMVGQNQSDEHHAEGEKVTHDHTITVDQRRDRLLNKLTAIRERAGAIGDRGVIDHRYGSVPDADDAVATPARVLELGM